MPQGLNRHLVGSPILQIQVVVAIRSEGVLARVVPHAGELSNGHGAVQLFLGTSDNKFQQWNFRGCGRGD